MFKRSFERLAVMPWAKTLKVAAWFVAGFTLLVGVPGAGLTYTDFGSFLTSVMVSLVVALVLALYGVGFWTYLWATSDVPQGWANFKKFWREFPENWRRFWRGVGAVLYWILMLPMTIGRAGNNFLNWLGTLPSRWRATPTRDKRAALLTGAMMFVMGGIAYQYWSLASRWASALPSWLRSDHDMLVSTLFIDVLLTAFTMILCMLVLSIVAEVVRALLGRRRGGQ